MKDKILPLLIYAYLHIFFIRRITLFFLSVPIIDKENIGAIGHSSGGVISCLLGSRYYPASLIRVSGGCRKFQGQAAVALAAGYDLSQMEGDFAVEVHKA